MKRSGRNPFEVGAVTSTFTHPYSVVLDVAFARAIGREPPAPRDVAPRFSPRMLHTYNGLDRAGPRYPGSRLPPTGGYYASGQPAQRTRPSARRKASKTPGAPCTGLGLVLTDTVTEQLPVGLAARNWV